MFAGRYIWWLLTSSLLFLLALAGFDYLVTLIMAISDCALREGTCYLLSGWLMGTVKPILVAVPAAMLLLIVLIRIISLRFLVLWLVPVPVWFASVAGTLAHYDPLWRDGADYSELLLLLPPAAYALFAFALFLSFPLEDEDLPEEGGAAPIGLLPGALAVLCLFYTFATSPGLAPFVERYFHAPDVAHTLENVRHFMATSLLVADGSPIPGVLAVILFALALALRIVRHERIVSGAI